MSLYSPSTAVDWHAVRADLEAGFGAASPPEVRATHATFVVEGEAEEVQAWLCERHPEVTVMSSGRSIEIYKQAGPPRQFVERFALHEISGSHALGHTRMATESRVTTAHSHPFSTGLDLCLVHNGSLSNHNMLRRMLAREGIRFQPITTRGRGRILDLADAGGSEPRGRARRLS